MRVRLTAFCGKNALSELIKGLTLYRAYARLIWHEAAPDGVVY